MEQQTTNNVYPHDELNVIQEDSIEIPMISWYHDVVLIMFLLMIVLGIPAGMLYLFLF